MRGLSVALLSSIAVALAAISPGCTTSPLQCGSNLDCFQGELCNPDKFCVAIAPRPDMITVDEGGLTDAAVDLAGGKCVTDLDCPASRPRCLPDLQGERTCQASTPDQGCLSDEQCDLQLGERCVEGSCQVPDPECLDDAQCDGADRVCEQGRCETLAPWAFSLLDELTQMEPARLTFSSSTSEGGAGTRDFIFRSDTLLADSNAELELRVSINEEFVDEASPEGMPKVAKQCETPRLRLCSGADRDLCVRLGPTEVMAEIVDEKLIWSSGWITLPSGAQRFWVQIEVTCPDMTVDPVPIELAAVKRALNGDRFSFDFRRKRGSGDDGFVLNTSFD